MTKKLDRKTVEVGRKRVPLRKLFHNKEIRVAAKALEDFRLHLIEQEFLLGAKITLQMDTYGECIAVAKRLESDNEYDQRMEKLRLADEAKKVREAKRKLYLAEKKKRDELMHKERVMQSIKEMAKTNGLSIDDLTSMLKAG